MKTLDCPVCGERFFLEDDSTSRCLPPHRWYDNPSGEQCPASAPVEPKPWKKQCE